MLKFEHLGDKDHHKPVFHSAMPFHLCLMIASQIGPLELVESFKNRCKIIWKSCISKDNINDYCYFRLGLLLASVTAVSFGVIYGCLDHEFLLSDNRFDFNYFSIYFIFEIL